MKISPKKQAQPARTARADVQRNLDALLEAAREVFATAGVDAPVREIATKAGVGVATVYRHFPLRSDLVAAVFRRAVDDCAAAAPMLASHHAPGEALARWVHRYAEFIATKRGLAAVLQSGDPAFAFLSDYFAEQLGPALRSLIDAAVAAGEIRDDVRAVDLLRAVSSLCVPLGPLLGDDGVGHGARMISLLLDGLRVGAGGPRKRKTR